MTEAEIGKIQLQNKKWQGWKASQVAWHKQ